jgi:hypothetical protein
MAIDHTYLDKGIQTTAGYTFRGSRPLDLRTVVPDKTGLSQLIEDGSAYPGLLVYVETVEGKDTGVFYQF